jgi:5-methylcytosine-specific restriction endonuclease McrA
MNKINYKEYITSKAWLLKKHELISIYLSQGWDICCNICESEHNLHVHHRSYKQLGNENLKDDGSGDIANLEFLCRDCHKKWHFDKEFRKKVEEERKKEFWEIVNEITQNGKI